ncbi:hypothetical protein E2C01_066976 [Portunus trituberculatus]|uniref:Uncharacterized protein n=1 Tax=Portunus trituberculatus TaxID=210409 RepID=A0A5B7HW92_PORTR|nr:hypothetical protein [Portunus trituberculatus]
MYVFVCIEEVLVWEVYKVFLDMIRLVFSNTCALHLHYFKRLYLNLHEFSKQSDTISTLLIGETLLKLG